MNKKVKNYVEFTEDMKKDYTVLIPNMLPNHFKMIAQIFRSYGYKMELLETQGREIVDAGLKYVHNDTCYPALLVIGQFINALQSGRYDPHKTALMMFQTGGGCRASNYISLIRKALQKAGYGYVPVISFNLIGLEKHSGFKLTVPVMIRLFYAIIYGDLLMSLKNQCKPYEINKGDADALTEKWTKDITQSMKHSENLKYDAVKAKCRAIVASYGTIPMDRTEKVKVGVVGEIFVKYSPLGNNNLEEFLYNEGAEVVVPGLLDFCMYYMYNLVLDYEIYGKGRFKSKLAGAAYNFLLKKQRDIIDMINEQGTFMPPMPFSHTCTLTKGYISNGAKMGEGWLLTAEMLELVEEGVNNIVCTQPFGCLPNHIVGKGMMKSIKENNANVNIVAIDYDPGATAINQENRLKLMLANARDALAAKQGV